MRVKSSIRDACDQRLPPTLPILAPTLRTVIERVEVSPALSMHHAFSRRATRFRGSTRFTQRRFLPRVKRCFPPRSIDRARSIEPTSERPRRLAFEHATPCGMHVSPVRPRSLPSPIRENERFSRPETPFIDRSNPLLLREAPVRGLLLKEVLGPRNADLFSREERWNRGGSRHLVRRFRGEPPPERGSPFWGKLFRSTPISRFCHRDPTSDVTSPGAVSRFWASTTYIPRPEPENRRAQRRRPTSATRFTMRGHLHTSASIPRACFWSIPGHVASGRFRVVPKLRAVHVLRCRRLRLAEIHRVEVAFPLGTPEPPLDESRTPRGHPVARTLLWRSSSRFEKVEAHPPASFREELPP